jgi:P-type Ca2+ transporter type 2C
MRRPPRDRAESVLTRRHWGAIVGYGVLIAATILLSLVLAIHWLGLPSERAISISFLTLAFARLWHVFNMRESGSGLVQNEVTTNPAVWAALALCTGLLLAAAYLPTLADILAVQAPDRPGWLLAMGLSLVPLAIGQVVKQLGGAGRPDRRNAT